VAARQDRKFKEGTNKVSIEAYD